MVDRPESVRGTTARIKTGCGWLYGTVSDPTEEYQEVFLRLGKCGGCAQSFLDGIGRLISLGLNQPLTKDLIHRSFTGIRCPSPMWSGNVQVLSCVDGIAKLLQGNPKKEIEEFVKTVAPYTTREYLSPEAEKLLQEEEQP